jgi:hypothetical protein
LRFLPLIIRPKGFINQAFQLGILTILVNNFCFNYHHK